MTRDLLTDRFTRRVHYRAADGGAACGDAVGTTPSSHLGDDSEVTCGKCRQGLGIKDDDDSVE
jgi:hypothetical protein